MNNTDTSFLIVDEQVENSRHFEEQLLKMGYEAVVFTATNADVALNMVAAKSPDLILIGDCAEMSESGGLTKLREQSEKKDLAMVFVTGETEQMVPIGSDEGYCDFLKRPFTNQEFRMRVGNLVALQRSKRTLAARDTLIAAQQAELQSINKAKERFLTNVASEIRYPLTLILGQSDLLLNEYQEFLPHALEQKVSLIHQSGEKLEEITKEINDLIKLHRDEVPVKRSVFNLTTLLDKLLEILDPATKANGLTIELDNRTPGVSSLLADPGYIERILFNLISNAIRFSPQDGRILLTWELGTEKAWISVTDEGPALPREEVALMFDHAEHHPDTHRTGTRNAGISFAFLKDVIAAHGGSVKLQETSHHQVKIELPGTDNTDVQGVSDYHTSSSLDPFFLEEIRVDATRVSLARTKAENPEGTILLVEDDELIREYTIETLENQYKVVEAVNGADAISKLRSHHVDLIITDVMMPVMDGFELVQTLNSDEKYAGIPCLIFSSKYSDDDRMKALGFGVNNYLPKPFNQKELLLRVKNLLANRADAYLQVGKVFEKYDFDEMTRQTIAALEKVVIDRIDDSTLAVAHLADAIAFSERKLFRFLKQHLEISPLEFIKQVRFQFVRRLLKTGKVKSLSEAARAVGLSNPSSFKMQYIQRFGEEPAI